MLEVCGAICENKHLSYVRQSLEVGGVLRPGTLPLIYLLVLLAITTA